MISKVRKDVYHLKRVWDLKNVLLWPPQHTDLQPEKFNIPWYLTDFLTSLLGGKNDVAVSSRNATIKYSMAQDIVYNMNGGKVKTPKSVLLPSVIKTLTNNTEIINIINHLGHGVLYSILSEMNTKNTFRIQEQQLHKIVIPEDIVKEKFTVNRLPWIVDQKCGKKQTIEREPHFV